MWVLSQRFVKNTVLCTVIDNGYKLLTNRHQHLAGSEMDATHPLFEVTRVIPTQAITPVRVEVQPPACRSTSVKYMVEAHSCISLYRGNYCTRNTGVIRVIILLAFVSL